MRPFNTVGELEGWIFRGVGVSKNVAVHVLCVLTLRFYTLLPPEGLVCGFLT